MVEKRPDVVEIVYILATHSHSNNSSLILYCISTLSNIHWKIFPKCAHLVTGNSIFIVHCVPFTLYTLFFIYPLQVGQLIRSILSMLECGATKGKRRRFRYEIPP